MASSGVQLDMSSLLPVDLNTLESSSTFRQMFNISNFLFSSFLLSARWMVSTKPMVADRRKEESRLVASLILVI